MQWSKHFFFLEFVIYFSVNTLILNATFIISIFGWLGIKKEFSVVIILGNEEG